MGFDRLLEPSELNNFFFTGNQVVTVTPNGYSSLLALPLSPQGVGLYSVRNSSFSVTNNPVSTHIPYYTSSQCENENFPLSLSEMVAQAPNTEPFAARFTLHRMKSRCRCSEQCFPVPFIRKIFKTNPKELEICCKALKSACKHGLKGDCDHKVCRYEHDFELVYGLWGPDYLGAMWHRIEIRNPKDFRESFLRYYRLLYTP